KSCQTLSTEVQMFQNCLSRIEGSRDPQQRLSLQMGGKGKAEASAFHRKSRASKFTDEKSLGLRAAQKFEIVNKEIEELTEASRNFIRECENTVDSYQATITEADTCLQAIKKDFADFDTDIIKGGVNPFSHAIKAEKCVRYLENKLKNLDSTRKKLILKYNSVKTQEKKVVLQLEQKEQIGDVLHGVDFDQLRIINQQYKQTFSERTRDLLKLKLMTGNAQKALNLHKRTLQDLNKESERIQNDITVRVDFMKRVDAEAKAVQSEISQAEKNNHNLRTNMSKYHAPTIMEYVLANTDALSLQSELKTWERRVRMSEIALGNYLRTWERMARILKN
ncbi:unnamed protein product, partial [Candidula unifasciata]